VRLDIVVTTDGTVSDVKVTKSLDKTLDKEAVQTVRTWKFLPAMKAGKPVPFKTDVAISFRLF
jgi:protein TonB